MRVVLSRMFTLTCLMMFYLGHVGVAMASQPALQSLCDLSFVSLAASLENSPSHLFAQVAVEGREIESWGSLGLFAF